MTDLKLIFLGTGAGSPSLARNVSSLGLQWTAARRAVALRRRGGDAAAGPALAPAAVPARTRLRHAPARRPRFRPAGPARQPVVGPGHPDPRDGLRPARLGRMAARHAAPDRDGAALPPDRPDRPRRPDLRGRRPAGLSAAGWPTGSSPTATPSARSRAPARSTPRGRRRWASRPARSMAASKPARR